LPSETVSTPAATTLTFVNSHLAAFDDMVEKRNMDFQEISKRMNFVATPARSTSLASSVPPLSLYESDVLFWLVRFSSDSGKRSPTLSQLARL
jgi:phosphatidylinositol-bisphosphatase